MHISKKQRILLLIAVDGVFFILEIVIGYTAHSLALVADAFHMLNDILSLCVGYWATDVAENRSSSNDYTYGWARAEILGGLVNGVFLIALCVTIVLEAIQRFFEIQEVSNPRLVLIVGGVGLLFNIMGLFLFHQHDHGHDEGHSHGVDELGAAEAGHADHEHAGHEHAASHADGQHLNGSASKVGPAKDKPQHRGNSVTWKDPDAAAEPDELTPLSSAVSGRSKTRHRRSNSRNYDSIENLPIHPASLRNDMRAQARGPEAETESETEEEEAVIDSPADDSPDSPLLKKSRPRRGSARRKSSRNSKQIPTNVKGIDHHDHKHSQPSSHSHGGHTHDDNLRGMFLHVLGDALGNVGVMASALIIWLTPWPFRFYFDPIISLFITLIILKSAIPLVRDTAKPLLQATPEHVNVEDIREDIESLPGISSCHHIHVWALTRSKLIATLDVQLDFDLEGKQGSARYMELAKAIKSCLHGHNIHNSTVQPEFCTDEEHHEHEHDHDHGHDHDHNEDNHHDHTHATADQLNRLPSSSSSSHTVIPYTTDSTANGKTQQPQQQQQRQSPHPSHAACGDGRCLLEDSCEGMQCCTPGAGGGSGTATPRRGGNEGEVHETGKGEHKHR